MKKLLSILSVAGVMGASSSTVVSCKAETIKKADLSDLTNLTPLYSNATADDAYQEVYSAIAAKGEDVAAGDISTGSESKTVTVELTDQDSDKIVDNFDELNPKNPPLTAAGDISEITAKIHVDKKSVHFVAKDYTMTMKVEPKMFTGKDLEAANYDGDILCNVENSVLYNNVREDIASKAGFNASDIKTGLFKDDIAISIWDKKTSKQIKDDSNITFTKTDPSKDVDVKVQFVNNTHYFDKTNKVVKISTDVEKTDASKIKYTSIKGKTSYSAMYDSVRTDLANGSYGAYKDKDAIKTSKTANFALYYKGKQLDADSTEASTINEGPVVLKLAIKNDKIFDDSNVTQEILINVTPVK